MKMTRCFHPKRWILLFCCFSVMFSFVPLSTTLAEEEKVIRAVGETLTFPIKVLVSGGIDYKDNIIGQVLNKQADTEVTEMFKNRLHWDSQTGFFTLTDLRTNDSGLYTVESVKEDKRKQYYKLTVYEKVSEPQVNCNTSDSKLCSLLCAVRNVGGLSLVWYKGNIILNFINGSSADTLNLPLEIETSDNDTYSCVASNPVSKRTTTVNITECCIHSPDSNLCDHCNSRHIAAIVCSVIAVIVIISVAVYVKRRNDQKKSNQHYAEDPSATEGLHHEVQYSEINHKNRSQANIRELELETCQLTTIYDQIRPRSLEASNSGRA